ncbi:MAG: type II toxin-antitoxin system RelE/ParE family toxin [Candidatus Omnitrophota bacterium]
MFKLKFTETALKELQAIESNSAKKGLCKQIKKSLGYLQTNPKHPSLNTHSYDAIENPLNPKEKVFGAYAQNETPSAYRIFWCYGSDKKQITILAITPHP